MCGYLCIRLIGAMLADENLVDFSGLFSPHNLKKDSIILSCFKDE